MYLRQERGETTEHKYLVDLNNLEPCAEYWLITRTLSINGDSYGEENIHRLVSDNDKIEEFRVIPGKQCIVHFQLRIKVVIFARSQ